VNAIRVIVVLAVCAPLGAAAGPATTVPRPSLAFPVDPQAARAAASDRPNPNLPHCYALEAKPAAASPGETVLLKVNGIDSSGCTVKLFDPASQSTPGVLVTAQPADELHVRLQVPLTYPGARELSSSPSSLRGQRTKGISFTVGETAPIVRAVTPARVVAGQTITITGDAFFGPPQALIVRLRFHKAGEMLLVPIVDSTTQLRVAIPREVQAALPPHSIDIVEPADVTVMRGERASAPAAFELNYPKNAKGGGKSP
jgi:hypothetical protein